jgi:hypothetical protein
MRTAQNILMLPLQMVNGLSASKLQTPASASMNDDDNDDDDKDTRISKNMPMSISNVNDIHTSYLLLQLIIVLSD